VSSKVEALGSEPAKPRKVFRFSRRRLIAAAIFTAPLMVLGDAKWVEPGWVRTKWLRLNTGKPAHRFVQFSDVHHKGDRAYLASVVKTINALSPEFVCFTGDLIEDQKHLDEALQILSGIKAPLYGVPGNHDYWSKAKFEGSPKVSRPPAERGCSTSSASRVTESFQSWARRASVSNSHRCRQTPPRATFS